MVTHRAHDPKISGSNPVIAPSNDFGKVFFFLEELILCSVIFIGLFISSLVKVRKTTFRDYLRQKKYFFLFSHFALMGLGLTSFLTFWDILCSPTLYFATAGDLLPITVRLVEVTDLPGHSLFRKDLFVQTFTLLLNLLVIFYFFLSLEYLRTTQRTFRYPLEIPVLLVTIFLSLRVFLMTNDFVVIVVALELAAFCSIILLGLQITTDGANIFAVEAAVKYFIFNAVGVAFLLFATSGFLSLYSSVNFLDIAVLTTLSPFRPFLAPEGLILFQFAFFFGYLMKLGAAPLHQWVPDVYEGAELLLTALLVLIVGPALNFKFFILIKALLPVFELNHFLFWLFLLTGFLSILIGSFNAFSQVRIKRFLAYAGITHLGFILVSFGSGTILGLVAAFFYLLFYIIANTVFFSLLLLSQRLSGIIVLFLNQLKLIANQNIFFFFFLFIPLFSYAGFPPFAGFFTKLLVLLSLVDFQHFPLLVAIIVLVVFSAFLYLRFIKIMLFEKNFFLVFLPLKQTDIGYYQLTNTFQQLKSEKGYTSVFFFLLFILNFLITAFIIISPTIFLLFLHPLLTLVFFY